jgi:hypothetical protein
MSIPMDRSNRVFGKLTDFETAFPTVESAKISYTEVDEITEEEIRKGWWDIHMQGGLITCGNRFCRGGGYEIDIEAQRMVGKQETRKEVELSCSGHEGTARRRGRRCERLIRAVINVKYKTEG